MKKETTLAVVFGILLGGAVAVFLIFKNHELQLGKKKAIGQSRESLIATPAANSESKRFTLDSPTDGEIVSKNTIKVSGTAQKDSLIIIESPSGEKIFRVEGEKFSVDFPVAFGENMIVVSMYPKDPTERSQEKTLKVYYLEEKL